DTTDYTTATKTVSIDVGQATPVITWATPAGITYGTALSGTQLDASTPVAGTFVYSPLAGTVLNAGLAQTLSVTFTPTDTTDYTTATKTVSIDVGQAGSSVAVGSSLNPSTSGQNITFTTTITVGGPASASGGIVTFMDGAAPIGTGAVDSSNHAAFSTTVLTVGTHSITAVYGGNTTYMTSSTSSPLNQVVGQSFTTVTIDPTSVSLSTVTGQNYSVVVTVVPVAPGTGTPTGQVDVLEGSQNCTVTLSGGTGSCSLLSSSAGLKSIHAIYEGDGNYAASFSSYVAHTVNQAATTTTLVTSGTPSPSGAMVTLTATVAVTAPGAGSPGGSVQFFDGLTSLGTRAVNPSSQATLLTSALTVGTHPITAIYLGDLNFSTSTSDAINQVVTLLGQTITFAPLSGRTYGDAPFTVSATGGGSGNAVTFTASGPCSVSGNQVSITGAGSCTITAHQAGNATYDAAPDVPQSFAIATKTLTITAASFSKTYGTTYVFDTTTPSSDFSVVGLVGSDSVSSVSLASAGAASGATVATYPITIGSAVFGSGTAGNYAITYTPGTLTVTPASQTISFGTLA
ncbi:MAG: Ig-like domain repeat protein, partial [Mycobacterium sp.]|nr:Ig-like domain repeat protein [Mycobacterium sp.]